MKNAAILILLLLLCRCSNQLYVRTDFDKSVEICRKTQYTWMARKEIESRNNPLHYNELNDKRIRQSVNSMLASKGYVLADDNPGFIAHYHIVIENKSTVRTDEYGYSYNSYWMRNQMDVYRYKEGTLIIDFMDAVNCELIWRGWAVSVLDDEKMVTEEFISGAVSKILETFPVSAEKEAREM